MVIVRGDINLPNYCVLAPFVSIRGQIIGHIYTYINPNAHN
jgi:hypothetical protein